MFWLKGRYYFASHNGFVVEGFAAVLMDGRPLPASSERLNERGAVITQPPTLLPEERGRRRRKGAGGATRAGTGWRASGRRRVEVGEDVGERSRPREKEERTCVMEGEEVNTGCSSPHTPVPKGSAERESALRKRGESRWYCETHKASLHSDQQSHWAVRVHG